MKRSLASFVLVLFTFVNVITPTCASVTPPTRKSAHRKVNSHAARRAQEKYHHAWRLIRENYIWQNKLTDWKSWEHRFDGELYDDSDANSAIIKMIKSLKDRRTYFNNVIETQKAEDREESTNVVSWKMLPNNIGYIKINTFASDYTAQETSMAFEALSKASAYVLDLRGNRGGLLKQSLLVFSLMIDEGVFGRMEARSYGKDEKIEYLLTRKEIQIKRGSSVDREARHSNALGKKPLVALTDDDTASASESLLGALLDYGLVELFGEKTYGKGVAGRTFDLQGHVSIHIIFARSFLPKGSSIHNVGIIPKHPVAASKQGDAVLDAARKHLENKLKP
jgi:C-terminal processing protease CtpA/Prc